MACLNQEQVCYQMATTSSRSIFLKEIKVGKIIYIVVAQNYSNHYHSYKVTTTSPTEYLLSGPELADHYPLSMYQLSRHTNIVHVYV